MTRFKCYSLVLLALLALGFRNHWRNGNGEKLQAYLNTDEPSIQLVINRTTTNEKAVEYGDSITSIAVDRQSLNRIVHVGQFGLGHRMSKLSGAYHLALRLRDDAKVPVVVQADWGLCQSQSDNDLDAGGPIFEYLFGDPILLLPGDTSPRPVDHPVEIRIQNDCPGYYGAQAMKNAKIPIPHIFTQDTPDSPFFHKMDTDAHLFALLQSRFEALHGEAKEFRDRHRFADHTVIGLHIRAGNGEQDHFQWKGRGVGNNDNGFLTNLALILRNLLGYLQERQSATTSKKPLLLFLATDTPTMIASIQKMAATTWHIPVVIFEQQPVLPFLGGVSFQALKTGQPCLEGWKAMMVDAILLGSVHVLIAALRSSFSQTMPLAMLFRRPNPKNRVQFCEVSEAGDSMTCLKNRKDWLFRNASREVTWTLNATHSTSSVIHLAGVHYPDVDQDLKTQGQFQVAVNFLKGKGTVKDPTATFLPWGSGFNRKYRQVKREYSKLWTFR